MRHGVIQRHHVLQGVGQFGGCPFQVIVQAPVGLTRPLGMLGGKLFGEMLADQRMRVKGLSIVD